MRRRLLRDLCRARSRGNYDQLSELKPRLGLVRDLWRSKELRARQLLHDPAPDGRLMAIEHQIYMCSACRHVARRLVFRRAKMPITHLPVIATPIDKLWKGRVAAPRAWGNAVEKLRSRQIDLKEKAAAAKTAGWTNAVEKLRSKQAALVEQAAVASRHAEPVRAPEAP